MGLPIELESIQLILDEEPRLGVAFQAEAPGEKQGVGIFSACREEQKIRERSLDADVRRLTHWLRVQPPCAHAKTPHVTGIADCQTQATAVNRRETAAKPLASQQVVGEPADQFRVYAIGYCAQELPEDRHRQVRDLARML